MAASILLGAAGLVHGISLTLIPTADTTLFQNSPDDNLGLLNTMIAGTTTAAQRNRALLKFDLAGLMPVAAVVQSVTLTLHVTRTVDAGARHFRLHRMKQDWVEGGGGAWNQGQPAQSGETTWNARFYPDQLWAEPGGGATNDYVAEPRAETMRIGVAAASSSRRTARMTARPSSSGSIRSRTTRAGL